MVRRSLFFSNTVGMAVSGNATAARNAAETGHLCSGFAKPGRGRCIGKAEDLREAKTVLTTELNAVGHSGLARAFNSLQLLESRLDQLANALNKS